ncbi:MAG: zinc ribbon domain-containing protein [Deltaproteobacteria bacterium]|nr:zinc ribbon domain-containing protein [Deltaproteobacteria bacterium]
MLYTYECKEHGEIDLILPLSEWDKEQGCPECNQPMKKIITLGHGGIQSENPVWLPSAVKVLQADHEPPITNRTEYNAYLKEQGIWERGGNFKIDGKWSMI